MSSTAILDPVTCGHAKEFAEWLPWKILIGTKLGIAVLAIAASYFLIRDVGVRWLVHPNAKVLFGNHIFWSSIAPVLYVVLYIIEMIRLSLFHEDPCDYLVPTSFAVIFRTFHVQCAMAQNFSVLALAIERMISAYYLEKYERVHRPTVGICLALLAVAACLLLPYVVYIFPFLGGDMMSSYTITISHRNSYNENAAPLISQIQLGSEFAALMIFHVTLMYSQCYNKKRLSRKTHSVARTYQAVENENIVRPLLYVFWTHFFVCSMQAFATATFKVWFHDGTLTAFAFYLEVFTQFPLYTILLTLLLHPRSCLRRKKDGVVNEIQEQDDYFKDLKKMFNTGLKKKQKRARRDRRPSPLEKRT